jgi:hypothetical protein
MKIGICFSGMPRGEYYPYWVDILAQKYECVTFVNYWLYDKDMHNHSYAATTHSVLMEEKFDESWYKFENCETIFSTDNWQELKPVFAKRLASVDSRYYGSFGTLNPMSMYYSIQKSFKLLREYEIKNNLTFDVVIRARFDMYVSKDFDYDMSQKEYNTNVIYTPSWNLTPINDCWAVGHRKPMEIYHNLYDHITDYMIPATNHPEMQLRHHLQVNNIQIRHWDFCLHPRINDYMVPKNVKKKSKI